MNIFIDTVEKFGLGIAVCVVTSGE